MDRSVEALLERRRQRRPLPAREDRRLRRVSADATQQQMAEAVLVELQRQNPGTPRRSLTREAVSRWEAPEDSGRGRDPRGDLRDAYAAVLDRIAEEAGRP